jgi:hypothetical protein
MALRTAAKNMACQSSNLGRANYHTVIGLWQTLLFLVHRICLLFIPMAKERYNCLGRRGGWADTSLLRVKFPWIEGFFSQNFALGLGL